MNGKRTKPLASRVVALQLRVTALTLLVVTIATAVGLSVVLSRKTDQQLEGVSAQVNHYLAEKPSAELDWQWLAAEVAEVRPSHVKVQLFDARGRQKFSQGDGPTLQPSSENCRTDGAWRVCGARARGLQLVVGKNREDDLVLLRTVVGLLGLLCVGACLGVAVLSRGATTRAVQPLSQLASQVAALEPGSGARIGVHSDVAEVDVLGERFDALVSRFEEALEREKRFTAEASHELRTPLTLAIAEMEALAQGEGDGAEPARALSALNRLAGLAESLLWFARAQGKVVDERTGVVNVCDSIRAQVAALEQANPGRRFSLELPDEALVQAEETLLGRAIGNLLDNAVKYGDASDILVRVERNEEGLSVSVINGGAGIPEAARSRVFVPFFRSTGANPGADGFGLGLPFARAVARAHGGDLRLGSAHVSKTELVLELPLVNWSDTSTRAADHYSSESR
jgi:signal transduction histidine kinase